MMEKYKNKTTLGIVLMAVLGVVWQLGIIDGTVAAAIGTVIAGFTGVAFQERFPRQGQ